VPEHASGAATVTEHRWGHDVAALGPPFDVIVACGKPSTNDVDTSVVTEAVVEAVCTVLHVCTY